MKHINSDKSPQRAKHSRPGFSLLELVLVMAIMGALMAVAAFSVFGQGERAKVTATKATLATIKTAVQQYHLENSSYPPDLNALVIAKILDAGKLSDGWKHALVYDPIGPSPEQPFILYSRGSDNQSPSQDDINAWEVIVQPTNP